MEQLDVFDCSNVLIASYFADDRECAHENREHTLIYQCSGRLEIEERGKKTVLYPGDCAFMRRDNRMWLQKRVGKGEPYRSIVLKFNTDRNLYASLFDFVEPWKIDILDYLNENYMCDLSMKEIASYTGRSLATFKRDFAKVSDLTPQKWIVRRRLEAAHDLIRSGKKKVTEACFDVGFKNLSHFSKVYKEIYGVAPSWQGELYGK
ncbi:MAG TPA: AraC family transcriptional regulator [Barnesiella sp.]|nr:AraC family transcriptional regulator [Barnesiella sp.]HBX17420.1 AraC family transcriptional regulator [Barnesiella sp.]